MNETCVNCGIVRPRVVGPTDPYGGASASCWDAFNLVLAADFSDWQPRQHGLIVDTYMAQHPSARTPASRRSLLTHLVGLHVVLESDVPSEHRGRLLAHVFPDKSNTEVPSLEPFPALTEISVAHVLDVQTHAERDRRVREWADAVWRAWRAHHERVRALAAEASMRATKRRR